MKRALRGGAWALAWLLALGYVVWAFGALYYDFPVLNAVVAWAFALAVLVVIIFAHGARRKLGATFFGFALVLAWWITLEPSNTRGWQPDVAQTAWAEVKGDEVTLHNVRNCDYRGGRLHAALGDAHRASVADHGRRPRHQLLGFP